MFRRRKKPVVVDLRGGQTVEVVGESHYQDALRRLCGGKTEAGHHKPAVAVLSPEFDNPHDSNAISVSIDGRLVGYMSRTDAKNYRLLIEEMHRQGQVARSGAWIVGGWRRDQSDQGHFGVKLNLGAPDWAHPATSPPNPTMAPRDPVHTGRSTTKRLEVGFVEGRHYTDWVEVVKEQKRAGNYEQALTMLYRLCDAVEKESQATGHRLAPWYFEQVAIEERRAGRPHRELAILERYESSPLANRGQFSERLAKARAMLPPPG